VNDKQPRKPPKEQILVERKQNNFAKEDHVVEPKGDDHDKKIKVQLFPNNFPANDHHQANQAPI